MPSSRAATTAWRSRGSSGRSRTPPAPPPSTHTRTTAIVTNTPGVRTCTCRRQRTAQARRPHPPQPHAARCCHPAACPPAPGQRQQAAGSTADGRGARSREKLPRRRPEAGQGEVGRGRAAGRFQAAARNVSRGGQACRLSRPTADALTGAAKLRAKHRACLLASRLASSYRSNRSTEPFPPKRKLDRRKAWRHLPNQHARLRTVSFAAVTAG